jgi:predicted glycosyltransferase
MTAAVARQPLRNAVDLQFLATGKSGLGHIRRITNIAGAMHGLAPHLSLGLTVNAPLAGLSTEEAGWFSSVSHSERRHMAADLHLTGSGPVAVDTAIIPGLADVDAPLCLVLRETAADKLEAFNLVGGRPWDLVCIPNPTIHWMPVAGAIHALRIEATGWIFRQATLAQRAVRTLDAGKRRVIISSGGGGTAETAQQFCQDISAIISCTRALSAFDIEFIQVAAPRMSSEAIVPGIDSLLNAGSRLNEIYADFDAVISTAGYNSVLELAHVDVPVLLVPIVRSLDDQVARSKAWEEDMGCMLVAGEPARSAAWLHDILLRRTRRAPVAIDPLGGERCARLILQLVR